MTIPDDDALAEDLLRRATSEDGYLASTTPVTNYQRIWARDGIICGLAGLLTGHADLALALRRTLTTLADHQTDLGHVPSNVYRANGTAHVSLGGLSGRADTVPWFIIGVCNYARLADDPAFSQRHEAGMRRGMQLLRAWEYNDRGLLYVPQSGDWADEYRLHGYVLYDQALRLWALRCFADTFADAAVAEQSARLAQLIQENYWPVNGKVNPQRAYHGRAQEVFLEKFGEKPYWLSAFAPGGYDATFDPLANALCLLLHLDEGDQLSQVVDYTQRTVLPDNAATGLLPSFYPAIRPGQPGWDELYANHKYAFRNVPDEFHNGGVWPVWNGFFGAALAHRGETDLARQYLTAIHALNRRDTETNDQPGYYENFRATDGQPIGTRACTWSAAGAVLLHHYLAGKNLYFGQNFTP